MRWKPPLRTCRGKAIDRYSQDYIELQTKQGVKFYKTPDAILQKQLEVYDSGVEKKASDNAIFKEILESQKKVRRACRQVGPGRLREPAHGVQPLLCIDCGRQGRAEKGLTRGPKPAKYTIRFSPGGVFFGRRGPGVRSSPAAGPE
jgi:hypothetical protein